MDGAVAVLAPFTRHRSLWYPLSHLLITYRMYPFPVPSCNGQYRIIGGWFLILSALEPLGLAVGFFRARRASAGGTLNG